MRVIAPLASPESWAAVGDRRIHPLRDGGRVELELRRATAGGFEVRPYGLGDTGLFVVELDHAQAAGRFLLTAENELLTFGLLHNPPALLRRTRVLSPDGSARLSRPPNVPRLEGSTLYLGGNPKRSDVFYHFMFNAALQLPLVAAWRGFEGFDRILIRQNLSPGQRLWLERLGAPPDKLVEAAGEDAWIELEHVFAPSLPFRHEQRTARDISGSAHALALARERLLGARPSPRPGRGRRIHLSRGDAVRRRIVNEPELRALLDRLGFETMHMGELSVGEQISLMGESDLLLGPHGSQLGVAFLAPPHAHLIELMSANHANLNTMMTPSLLVGQTGWRVIGEPVGEGDVDFHAPLDQVESTVKAALQRLSEAS